mmetsp:Transcript_1605/g.1430  ORF Transcript_1605/g.1430 Transcript_1605/m.1430 type:complete len:83 (-) Transcript_1605:2347-2595(-)
MPIFNASGTLDQSKFSSNPEGQQSSPQRIIRFGGNQNQRLPGIGHPPNSSRDLVGYGSKSPDSTPNKSFNRSMTPKSFSSSL